MKKMKKWPTQLQYQHQPGTEVCQTKAGERARRENWEGDKEMKRAATQMSTQAVSGQDVGAAGMHSRIENTSEMQDFTSTSLASRNLASLQTITF